MTRMRSVTLTLVLGACGADTGGELVEAEVAVAVEAQDESDAPGRFVTQTGWNVELSEATVAVQSILAYAPSHQRLSLSRLWLGRALAHGGFDPFNGRRVRIEHVGPTLIDALEAGQSDLGWLDAEAGEMDSATLVFGDLTDHEGQIWVKGTARRDAEVIDFEGALQLEDETLLRRVDGVKAEGSIEQGGTFVFGLRPSRWFDEAHFERLAQSPDGPRQIERTSQVHTAWHLAARSSATYFTQWMGP